MLAVVIGDIDRVTPAQKHLLPARQAVVLGRSRMVVLDIASDLELHEPALVC
jgi:hypothetical protein